MDFHPSRKFIMPINGISRKATLYKRTYILSVLYLSKETLLLGLFPLTFSFVTYSRDFKLNILTTVYLSSNHPTFSTKAGGPIYNLGPHLSLPFICPWITSCSRSRPQAQYIIWALIPTPTYRPKKLNQNLCQGNVLENKIEIPPNFEITIQFIFFVKIC